MFDDDDEISPIAYSVAVISLGGCMACGALGLLLAILAANGWLK